MLLKACRRVVGLLIVIISICFACIGFFGQNIPGFLRNRGFTVQQLVQYLCYTQEGIFGTPVEALLTFIFLCCISHDGSVAADEDVVALAWIDQTPRERRFWVYKL